MEKGLNRKEDWQIEADTMNQSNAKTQLMQFLDVDIVTQDNFSIWDWEFYRNGKLLALGEYRRRFNKSTAYPDFIFSKKKFDILESKGVEHKVPCLFFVEFDDIFLYFPVAGKYPTRIVRRKHEVREEECVCITPNSFLYVNELSL
jgi:hypothetical protein